MSFSQAMERLKGWKNRRQVNKSVGDIPKLEAQLAQVRENLEALEASAALTARLEGEQAALARTRDGLARQAEIQKDILIFEQVQRPSCPPGPSPTGRS